MNSWSIPSLSIQPSFIHSSIYNVTNGFSLLFVLQMERWFIDALIMMPGNSNKLQKLRRWPLNSKTLMRTRRVQRWTWHPNQKCSSQLKLHFLVGLVVSNLHNIQISFLHFDFIHSRHYTYDAFFLCFRWTVPNTAGDAVTWAVTPSCCLPMLFVRKWLRLTVRRRGSHQQLPSRYLRAPITYIPLNSINWFMIRPFFQIRNSKFHFVVRYYVTALHSN